MSAGSKRGSNAGSDELQSLEKNVAKAEDEFKETSKALMEASKALMEAQEDRKKAADAHDAVCLDLCQMRGLLQWADTQSDIDLLNFIDYAEAAIASNSAAHSAAHSAAGDEVEEVERVAAALASAQAAVRAKRPQVMREEAQSDFISAYGVAMLQKQEKRKHAADLVAVRCATIGPNTLILGRGDGYHAGIGCSDSTAINSTVIRNEEL